MMGYSTFPARDPPATGAAAAETAATALLDVVVFAGGDSPNLMPLTAVEQKCMLRICNRPMIWYCLAPWVEAGFRAFFIVVNEDYATMRAYLSRVFPGVDFYYVFVPLTINDEPSTTCDGVKAYLEVKEQIRNGTVDGSVAVQDGADANAIANGNANAHANAGSQRGRASASASSPTASARQVPLRTERAAMSGLRRDALLLSCDTILAGVDVERYVNAFYSSLASVSALFFRPMPAEKAPGAAAEGKGHGKKKGGGQGNAGPARKSFTYNYTCVAYEEEEEDDEEGDAACRRGGAGASKRRWGSSKGGSGSPQQLEGEATVQHHQLHYMYPLDERPELRITMPFAARRPNLNFAADVVDAHAYLVRHWVLDLIAASAGDPEATVRKHVVPLLARSQHTTVNMQEGAFITPDKKINHAIPTHWVYCAHGSLSIDAMNAASGTPLPECADNLRVFCTIITESPTVPTKIYRINTRDNYQAVNQEIIDMKCGSLHLLDEPATAATAAASARGGSAVAQSRNLPLLRAPSVEGLYGSALLPPNLHASASALSYLLPDNPFTVRERLGSQQVFILGSFLDSAPPPNTYVTRSVIGPNVTIGAGARITDSVILANVDIGAKAVVANSVVGASAVIEAEMRVTNSIIGPRCFVEEDALDTIVE